GVRQRAGAPCLHAGRSEARVRVNSMCVPARNRGSMRPLGRVLRAVAGSRAERTPMRMTFARTVLVAALSVWPLGVAWAQPASSPSQDPLAGSRVFGAKGCVKCHSVNGVGGKIGPDLANSTRPQSFFDLATAM